jgi:hypothetical protein
VGVSKSLESMITIYHGPDSPIVGSVACAKECFDVSLSILFICINNVYFFYILVIIVMLKSVINIIVAKIVIKRGNFFIKPSNMG